MLHTRQLRQVIEEAIAVEKQEGHLADALRASAGARGLQLTSHQFNSVFIFIHEYIEHIPALLEDMMTVAENQDLVLFMRPLLEEAEKYFLAPSDLIPDRLGLLGLLDDAYVVHCIIQTISDTVQEHTGHPILLTDLSDTNQFIRDLIGEPHASLLDAAIEEELEHPAMQTSLLTLLESGKHFRLTSPDPIWGDVSIDDIISAQAGLWGRA
ncbi:MAG TPA: DUF1232 domain-containing protein [bacterium]|nr:DUF1232 domain-containing protein [bacterium]